MEPGGVMMTDKQFKIVSYVGKWLNFQNPKSNPCRWAKVGSKRVVLEFWLHEGLKRFCNVDNV